MFAKCGSFFCSFLTFFKKNFKKERLFEICVNKNGIKRYFSFFFWFLALYRRVSRALKLFSALNQALFDPFCAFWGPKIWSHWPPAGGRPRRALQRCRTGEIFAKMRKFKASGEFFFRHSILAKFGEIQKKIEFRTFLCNKEKESQEKTKKFCKNK